MISNLAVMAVDPNTKELYLKGNFPGITRQQILDNMEFDVDVSRSQQLPLPSDEELRILREVCDPQRLILG